MGKVSQFRNLSTAKWTTTFFSWLWSISRPFQALKWKFSYLKKSQIYFRIWSFQLGSKFFYLLCWPSILVMVAFIFYESQGLAGNFRTIINQLVSWNYLLVRKDRFILSINNISTFRRLSFTFWWALQLILRGWFMVLWMPTFVKSIIFWKLWFLWLS